MDVLGLTRDDKTLLGHEDVTYIPLNILTKQVDFLITGKLGLVLTYLGVLAPEQRIGTCFAVRFLRTRGPQQIAFARCHVNQM